MADSGIVALDPARLGALEDVLRTAADTCVRAVAEVGAALAGTGGSAPAELDGLGRLADWCRTQADGIARRRALVEALPVSLPRPAWDLASPAVAESRARAAASRLRAVLEGRAPADSLLAVLDDVRRGLHSPAYADRLARSLGPLLLTLPRAIEARFGREGAAPDLGTVARAREVAADLFSRVAPRRVGAAEGPAADVGPVAADRGLGQEHGEGDGAPDDVVVARLEAAARRAGLGADVVLGLGRAVRAARGTDGARPRVSPVAVVNLVGDVAAAGESGDHVDALVALASAVRAVAPATGPAAPAAYLTAAVLGFCAWAESHDQPDDQRDVRRTDPSTGRRAYPSGSPSNPNVDVAGVPLDPRYV